MKIQSYFLAATPQWTKASIVAYYDFVDKIHVSYDSEGLGWGGKPVDVEPTLKLLREIDTKSKLVYHPGSYHDTSVSVAQNELNQRKDVLRRATEDGADWVLQLDADEVLTSPETFFKCLKLADAGGYGAMEYPALFLYQYVGGSKFLVTSNRFLRIAAGFPGPVALRRDSVLTLGRQCDAKLFRVDFATTNTDVHHPKDAPVHHVVKHSEALLHYAWVRSKKLLQKKFENHASLAESAQYQNFLNWEWCGKHPYLAMLRSPFLLNRQNKRRLKLINVPAPNSYVTEELELLSGELK